MGQIEVSDQKLVTQGTIPKWLEGILVRNGPVTVTIDGKTNEHWFDGLAMLHQFSFSKGEVQYTNRYLRTEAYKAVFEDHTLNYPGFAVDPCRTLFQRFLTLFKPANIMARHNANVNVAKMAEEYVALTEIPLPVTFDPKTLETLGVLNYKDQLPKTNCWSSAHPHTDLNYTVIYGMKSRYTIYTVDKNSSRVVIADIPVEQPSYMHSFSVTENYIILTEYPLTVNPLKMMLGTKAFIKNYEWHPEQGTTFIVVDRKTGKVEKNYHTRSFFSFHHVNAFERDGNIYLDMITYEDASIITHGLFNIDSGEMKPDDNYHTRLERFCLTPHEGIFSNIICPHSLELPRINEAYDGKPYRYMYAMGFSDSMTERSELLYSESLCKVDTITKQVWKWEQEGCSAGEPVFVPSPQPKSEDDGIILSVVLDRKHGQSFLLLLNAKDFTEIGRALAPHAIPPELHGQFFK